MIRNMALRTDPRALNIVRRILNIKNKSLQITL